jgi:hypothetical protein
MKLPGNPTLDREIAKVNPKENPKDENDVRETIEILAYKFSEERGNENGSPLDDWLKAERLVRKHHASLA